MRQTAILIAAGLALAFCAHNEDNTASPAESVTPMIVDGQAAYEEHCAACHETGMLGAPREGEQLDWEARSDLWQAVLMEHAKVGHFDMPARGGKSDLPDEVVNAATQYMLELAFPDRPRD